MSQKLKKVETMQGFRSKHQSQLFQPFRPHSPTRVHFNEENNQYFSRPNSIYVDQINLSTIPNSDEPDVVRTHSDQQQPQDAFENIAYIDDSSSSAENLDRAS